MASTALMGTVFCILVIFPMYFYHLLRLLCVPQGVPVANKCQMSSDINILYHRNGLNTKSSLHSSAYFTFLSILVNLLLTGNDMCHSQPKL